MQFCSLEWKPSQTRADMHCRSASLLASQLGASRLLLAASRQRFVTRNSAPQNSRLRSMNRRFTSAAVSSALCPSAIG